MSSLQNCHGIKAERFAYYNHYSNLFWVFTGRRHRQTDREKEREREEEREREIAKEIVCGWKREGGKVCICNRDRERECVCVCVCERERE